MICKLVGLDEEATTVFNGVDAARPTAVVVCGGLRQAVEKKQHSLAAALAVLEGVVERGEGLEPPLDARVVAPHSADALKRFVFRTY